MTLDLLTNIVPVIASLSISLLGIMGSLLAWKQKGYIDLKKTMKQLSEVSEDVLDAFDVLSENEKKDKDIVLKKVVNPKVLHASALIGHKMKVKDKKNLAEILMAKLGF